MWRAFNTTSIFPQHFTTYTKFFVSFPPTKSQISRQFSKTAAKKEKDVKSVAVKLLDGVGPRQAIPLVREHAKAKFDEGIEIHVRLGLDVRKPNQTIRKTISLPHGTGRKTTIALITSLDESIYAASSPDVVGGQDLIEKILQNEVKVEGWSHLFATDEMMPEVKKKLGKLLGPKKLMPNDKVGTILSSNPEDISNKINQARKGSVEIRTDKYGFIRCLIGKLSFGDDQLEENLRQALLEIKESKPEGVKSNSKYILTALIKSTMGPAVMMHTKSCDAGSKYFFTDVDLERVAEPVKLSNKRKTAESKKGSKEAEKDDINIDSEEKKESENLVASIPVDGDIVIDDSKIQATETFKREPAADNAKQSHLKG